MSTKKEMSVSRKENWGKSERDALVGAYYERVDVIEGKFSSSVTSAAKSAAWAEIIQQVNSQSVCQRTSDGCKRKIGDLKYITKRKERRNRIYKKATGGGTAPEPLEQWEEKIISHMSDAVIMGIEEGVDTFQESLEKKCDSQKVNKLPNRPVNVGANIKQSTSGGVCDRVEAERSTSDRGEEMEAKEAEEDTDDDTGAEQRQIVKSSQGNKRMKVGDTCTHKSSFKKRKTSEDSCNSYIEIEKKKLEIMKEDLILKKEIVAIKKMRAEQEERKVRALEEITNSLKMPTYQIPGLSPVINIR